MKEESFGQISLTDVCRLWKRGKLGVEWARSGRGVVVEWTRCGCDVGEMWMRSDRDAGIQRVRICGVTAESDGERGFGGRMVEELWRKGQM